MAGLIYMVVTDDAYELPMYMADSSEELAQWLGMANANCVASTLAHSKTGVVKAKNKSLKYMRIDPDAGTIFVGRLPKEIKLELTQKKAKGRKPKAVIGINGNGIRRFESAGLAADAVGRTPASILQAVRRGAKCAGYRWYYEEAKT